MVKVVVAEDEEIILKALKMQLESDGFEVHSAPNGKEVLKLLADITPDIILLDLMMPEMDGFETLKELSLQPKFNNIPIMVLSNLSQTEEITKAKNLGADEFFVKADNDLSTITLKINQLVNSSQK